MRHERAIAALLAATAGSAGAAPAACPLPGEAVQWMADFCFATLGTDDEIAASDCIEVQFARQFASDCAAKAYYKKRLCGLMIENGSRKGPVARCEEDPAFMGDTVRDGGVGN